MALSSFIAPCIGVFDAAGGVSWKSFPTAPAIVPIHPALHLVNEPNSVFHLNSTWIGRDHWFPSLRCLFSQDARQRNCDIMAIFTQITLLPSFCLLWVTQIWICYPNKEDKWTNKPWVDITGTDFLRSVMHIKMSHLIFFYPPKTPNRSFSHQSKLFTKWRRKNINSEPTGTFLSNCTTGRAFTRGLLFGKR